MLIREAFLSVNSCQIEFVPSLYCKGQAVEEIDDPNHPYLIAMDKCSCVPSWGYKPHKYLNNDSDMVDSEPLQLPLNESKGFVKDVPSHLPIVVVEVMG